MTDNPMKNEEVEPFELDDLCEYCGRDPYHREDNGCGMVPVAVNCCDEAIAATHPKGINQ